MVIDFATSATAYGKVEIAQRRGAPIPPGWAIDRDGGVRLEGRTTQYLGAYGPP